MDPLSFGVGHIEPDNHSDDSVVEDVRRIELKYCFLGSRRLFRAAQANIYVQNRTDSPYSQIRTQHSDLQVFSHSGITCELF